MCIIEIYFNAIIQLSYQASNRTDTSKYKKKFNINNIRGQ